MNNKKTRPLKTLKCSRSKTIRPRKLKNSHYVDLLRSTGCELFSFLCLIVLDLEHFKVLGGLVFCLFTLYSHFMVCFIFLCLYYTDPFKIPSMNVTWEFYQNSRQTKKFKKTMKSLNIFWKNLCLQHFSDRLLTLLTFRKDGTLSKWCRNIPHNAETFWTIKELSGQSENFPDILESFHTIWKLSRHSGNFPDNMESVHKIWKVYIQHLNFLDNQ